MSGSPERFAIGFDRRDRDRLHALWDAAIAAERWSEGPMTGAFEAAWAAWNGLDAVAFASWTGATHAALEYVGVRGQTVLCPSNTFMATPLVALHAGAEVAFVDCNRDGRAVQGGRDAERVDQRRGPGASALRERWAIRLRRVAAGDRLHRSCRPALRCPLVRDHCGQRWSAQARGPPPAGAR